MDKTLLLVDGSSYLYRAFHAMPDLRNTAGQPTGALYGIINMMKRLRTDYPSATHLACVFDAKGKTFRDDLYPDYKAQRPSMPTDLVAQIEPIHAAIRALGWPVLCVPGVEADDVIASLAVQATAQNVHSIISTGDKDLAQLVNAHVRLVNTMSNEVLDPAGVVAKFGVPPERIVDYLALIGDTVDNIPGVEKCGPKTAVKWLNQYGSLDEIIAHAAEIKGVVGDNLRKAVPQFALTRSLLVVKQDVAGLPGPDDLHVGVADAEALKPLYEHYGFRTWLRELSGDPNALPAGDARIQAARPSDPADLPEKITAQYETILTAAALERWLAIIAAAPLTSFDTETTSLDPMQAQLVGMSFCVTPGVAAYLPLAHRYAGAPVQLDFEHSLALLRPWLEDQAKPKLLQHAKYDMHVLRNHGIDLRGVVHDTMLAGYVLESHKSNSLEALSERWLGHKGISYEAVCGKGVNQICFDQVSIERASEYSSEDADLTLRVHQALAPQLEQDPGLQRIYALELATQPVLFAIERSGVRIDSALLAQQSHEIGISLMALEAQAFALAGQPFNLSSPKQLGELLFGKMQLPIIKKTPAGAPSTDEEVLSKLAQDYPLPKVILENRSLAKLKSTYTDKLPKMINAKTGRVHTHYAQAAVVTGRLSSADPNLQNIPVRTIEGRRIREAFIAAPGHQIISADYSQIELRIMAHISGDASLKRAFAEGLDVHRATAAEIFGGAPEAVSSEHRRYAKVINFGLIYGMSAFGLAANLGIERDAAKRYIDTYFARYPGVAAYMDRTRIEAKSRGYVETVLGRRLWLPEINSPNGQRRQGAERAAINAPMQGTAADLIKLAMVDIQAWLGQEKLASRIIMQVHDELVLEVPDAEVALMQREIPARMSQAATLDVPLLAEVGTGPNWERAH